MEAESYAHGATAPGERRAGESRLLPSALSVVVAVVLICVTIVGYAFAQRNTAQQEQALLQSDASQAAAYASQTLNDLGSILSAAATVVVSSNGSPAAFSHAEHAAPPTAIVLATPSAGGYRVLAASGGGFRAGQLLTGAALTTVAGASAKSFTSGPVTFNGKLSTARFALAAPTQTAHDVVYEQFSLNPFTATPVTTGKPFDHLDAALYGPGAVSTAHLLVSTAHTIPLVGTVARVPVDVGSVGSSEWTLVASARQPFIGGYARFSGLVLLVLGLFIALTVGLTIEVLHRRQRYAKQLVAERTAELERSLHSLEEAQEALVQGERLAAVGEMALVIGHELRNPLAAVTNALYLIRSQVHEPMTDMLARNLQMAERETGKAATLADDLMAYVRPRETVPSVIEVEDLLDEVISVTPPPPDVELITELEADTLLADRGQMAEILTNLVTNAYQAIPDGGTLRISVTRETGGVNFVLQDSGPGIDETVKGRIFEPFFTTKHSGTGLGLAIVQRLVTAQGGTIEFVNAPGGGARATVVVPAGGEMATR